MCTEREKRVIKSDRDAMEMRTDKKGLDRGSCEACKHYEGYYGLQHRSEKLHQLSPHFVLPFSVLFLFYHSLCVGVSLESYSWLIGHPI